MTSLSILYLEDTPEHIAQISARLEDDAITLNVASSACAWRRALRAGTCDLLLIGYDVAGYEGLSALTAAREQRPDLPIIVVSEPRGEAVVIEALTHGASDYVLIHDLDRLPAAIERAMRQADERARQEQAAKERKRSIRELQFINETIVEASRTRNIDALCQLIAERVHSVNPRAYVFVSLYDEKLDAVRLRAMKVDQTALEQAQAVVKMDFRKVTFQSNEIGDAAHFYTSGRLEHLPNGVATLLAGKVPRTLAQRVVRLWGIDAVYTVGFALDDQPYGGTSRRVDQPCR